MSDPGPALRPELAEFAKLMELRMQASEGHPTRSVDKDHILSRMFEEVCDLREAASAGRSALPDLLDVALLALRFAVADGQLGNADGARGDSVRVRDAAHDRLKESGGKYAFKLGDRWTLFGAELDSDQPVTNEMIKATMPAILEAMRSLHAYNVRVGRIEVHGGRVRVFPEAGMRDPRSVEVEAVVAAALKPPRTP